MTDTADHTAVEEATWRSAPRCLFHVRTRVTDDPATYRYDLVVVRGGQAGEGGSLTTPHPPAVGDLIWLRDALGEHHGIHRVVDRSWQHPEYGSADWPLGAAYPIGGPLLQIVVEPDAGPFRDEAPAPSEEAGP